MEVEEFEEGEPVGPFRVHRRVPTVREFSGRVFQTEFSVFLWNFCGFLVQIRTTEVHADELRFQ